MKKHQVIRVLIGLLVILAPWALWADDTNIKVNIDTKGIADEKIKIEEHELKTKEYLDQKQKAEKIRQSDEYCRVGDMYYSKGEIERAAQYYEKALDANENNIKAHESLLRVQKEISMDEAETGYHYHKAMDYLRMGVTQKAIDELVLELKINPGNEEARMRLDEIEGHKKAD